MNKNIMNTMSIPPPPPPTPPSSATITPSPSGTASVGYRNGAWANYTTQNYDSSGDVTATYNLRYAVSQGTLKGVDCWILQTDNRLSIEDSIMNTATTYWLDKS